MVYVAEVTESKYALFDSFYMKSTHIFLVLYQMQSCNCATFGWNNFNASMHFLLCLMISSPSKQ